MAYKRISPMPIIEGGTNTSTITTTNGTVYFDGTKLSNVSTGTTGQILLSQGGSGSAPTFTTPSSSSGIIFNAGGSGSIVNTNSQYNAIIGFAFSLTSSTNIATIWPVSGTFSSLYVNIFFSNTSSSASMALNINGTDTALVATIPSSTTGIFTDLVHSISVNAGDAVCFHAFGSGLGVSQAQGVVTVKFS